jgi:hypothetical protein
MSGKRDSTQPTPKPTTLAAQNENGLSTQQSDSPTPQFFDSFVTDDSALARLLTLASANTNLPFGAKHVKGNMEFSTAVTRSIRPRDGLEGLLAVQMVATHNLALHYLRLAEQDQTARGIELFTKSANLLLRTFTKQVEALKTYRSKGEQKVEVEHVHVHRGGQAVVGMVTTRGHAQGVGDVNNCEA